MQTRPTKEEPRPLTAPVGARGRVVLVDDDPDVSSLLSEALAGEGFSPQAVGRLDEAQEALRAGGTDLVLLDLTLPDGDGLTLLDFMVEQSLDAPVIVLTGDASAQTAVEALRRGAYDYIAKPFDLDSLLNRVHNALSQARARDAQDLACRIRTLGKPVKSIRLTSAPMQELYRRLERVAAHEAMPVLIVGKTGVGKEGIAEWVHELSPRSEGPFVAVNCATLDRNLLQSELFGHEKGAFTGATERRKGLFELASMGTLFLDEVAEMPAELQASFLRVVETQRFRRMGGSSEIETKARIVVATNKDLAGRVREGTFREDLLFRLNTIELYIPPLKDRPEDIETLARHFCGNLSVLEGNRASLSQKALEALKRYPWPGNVRELKNVIERAIVLSGPGTLEPKDLQLSPAASATGVQVPASWSEGSEPPLTLAEVERAHVLRVIEYCKGNKTQAAEVLDIARNTLLRKIEELDADGA